MSLIGYPMLDRPLAFGSGRVLSPFGGGPFLVEPSRYSVARDASGRVEWRLELVRALSDADSRATFSCTIAAEYPVEAGLARAREVDPAAAVAPLPVTDEWFRILPSPALAGADGLTAPVHLASSGLGTGRLWLNLPVESGLLLESVVTGGGPLEAVAEIGFAGVSPRMPGVVRFDPAALLSALLDRADVTGALPFTSIVSYFQQDLDRLPLAVTGAVTVGTSGFAESLADRVVDRFGRYIPAQDVADAPVVALDRQTAAGTVTWSLSEPVLARRRMLVPIDLLSATRLQIAQHGIDSVIERRDLVTLPPLGQATVTVLATLPSSRAAADTLGVTLEFPPNPPSRPQARTATAIFDGSDVVRLTVQLAPDEPVSYAYTPFAIVTDSGGARQVTGQELAGTGDVLRLSPDDFPVDFALCEGTSRLAALALLTGVCSWEIGTEVHQRVFTLDSGRLVAGIAVPRERDSLRIDVLAVARDGSGQLALGPFESSPVRLDLSTFGTYGPRQAEIRCDFDDAATVRAVTLLPAGDEDTPGNATTIALTPAEPDHTYRWFARSPFAPGYRYRLSDHPGAPWTTVLDGEDLSLRSSQFTGGTAREIAVRSGAGLKESLPGKPRRVTEAGALEDAPAVESGVVPVGVSPDPVPTDDLVYSRVDDPTRKAYVPRYVLDVQSVSGQQRYRIAMTQGETTSTLTVHLVATTPPTPAAQAPGATELPHLLTIALDFLVSSTVGARKTLEFTDVTRSGFSVTAVLTFASLAERDDVYSALVDRSREARLLVRRHVDLLVPNVTSPTSGWDVLVAMPVLPVRPMTEWPPRKLIRVPDEPIVFTKPPTPIDPWRKTAVAARTPLNLVRGTLNSPVVESGPAAGILANRWSNVVLPVPVFFPTVAFADGLPTPQLSFTGRDGDRGLICVTNWAEFSADFFAPSPGLPPCGRNTDAARTWVDVEDADSGARLYGFCALASSQNLSDLWFPMAGGSPASVRVRMTDRSMNVERVSNAVATTVAEPPSPPQRPVRQELVQTVEPTPFAFSADLHRYIFEGVTPRGGDNQLIRHRIARGSRTHTYLQDASRPWVVYVLADEFKIARRPDPPYSPFATVRVRSVPGGQDTQVVFDYVVAPHTDPARLADARTRLLADPRFGADRVEFQPLLTSDVRFAIDRPSVSGAVREERPDAAMVLQGWLKDTLTMPLADFRLLFDAMHTQTASMFLGRVEIDLPSGDTEIIPFTARMDDLEGEMFSSAATAESDGTITVRVTNCIESTVDVQTLDPTIRLVDRDVGATIRGGVPREGLLPGAAVDVVIEPDAPITAGAEPEVFFDLSGVTVVPDPEAIWTSILDRTTVEYYRLVSVRVIPPGVFQEVPGEEGKQVSSVLVEFEGGGTTELTGAIPTATARIDYSIDDVILKRPVSSTYRYTVTVVRADGQLTRDAQPRQGTADVLFISVVP